MFSLVPSPIKAGLLLPFGLGVNDKVELGSDPDVPVRFASSPSSRYDAMFESDIEVSALSESIADSSSTPVAGSGNSSRTKTDVGVDTEPVVDVISEPIIEPIIEPVIGSSTIPPIKEFPIIPPIIPSVNINRKVSVGSRGFDVFVRKRGVFVKASSFAMSKKDALDFGAFTVSNTARATFDVRPSSSSIMGGSSISSAGAFNKYRSNFYKKGGLFIEKRNKRITSLCEKAEITSLGIASV